MRARYLDHVTGYQPIGHQYFLSQSVAGGNIDHEQYSLTILQRFFIFASYILFEEHYSRQDCKSTNEER